LNSAKAAPIRELKALTSLRFFAALMIVAHHMRGYLDPVWLQFAPDSLVQGGSFFFVLSGFILTHVYRADRDLKVAGFISLRLARLYPPIWPQRFLWSW
jgi:peptidoglycan/LPS O-acetylase OafA/YrhL